MTEFVLESPEDVRTSDKTISHHRWFHWCVYLGVLDGNSRPPVCLQTLNRLYEEAVVKSKQSSTSLKRFDPNLCNPLSKAADNPWVSAHKDSECIDEIWKDVTRTFPEREFFQNELNQKAIQQVIFTWCKVTGNAYKQGINEITAIIFHSCIDDLVGMQLEAVVFAVLSALLSIDAVKAMFYSSGEENLTTKRCDHVFNELLKSHNPDLFKHLGSVVEVPPSLFLLRWLRLLFSREFHIDDVVKVWDVLFADKKITGAFDLSDYLCIAMLDFVSKDLFVSDNSACLRRLLKYPPVGDVAVITHKALSLKDPSIKKRTDQSLNESTVIVAPQVIAAERVTDKSITRSKSIMPADVWDDSTDWESSLNDAINQIENSGVADVIQSPIESLKRLLANIRASR